jgi:hypothetical protein
LWVKKWFEQTQESSNDTKLKIFANTQHCR